MTVSPQHKEKPPKLCPEYTSGPFGSLAVRNSFWTQKTRKHVKCVAVIPTDVPLMYYVHEMNVMSQSDDSQNLSMHVWPGQHGFYEIRSYE